MSKVLIVDDEENYRDLVSEVLSFEGHETRTAASGREALDVGARYHPDVLVTDWMLKDDIHGLHVVSVLRAILPDLRAILMTGFATDDLRENANQAGVYAFIEKPFDAQGIETAVREAAAGGKDAAPTLLLAMMEVDAAGSILFASAAAKEMMDEAAAGRDAGNLADLWSGEVLPALDAAMDRWAVVSLRSGEQHRWHLRSQEPREDGSRLIVLRRSNEAHYFGLSLVGMLLGVRDIEHTRWPFDERVLIIDDEAMLRALSVSMLESVGAGCYAVGTAAEALRLLERDGELRFVVLDFEMPGTDARLLVETIRTGYPDVTIVGSSGPDRRDDFAAMGVEFYLDKPWRANDLINLLTGRIGKCVSCDIPIPLRRPKPGETADSWECRNCGARYRAILDPDCPEDTLRNVHRAEPG